MSDDVVKGRRVRGGVRASRTFEEGRICARDGCHTRLSRYNRRDHCHVHAPVRFPRLRGRAVES